MNFAEPAIAIRRARASGCRRGGFFVLGLGLGVARMHAGGEAITSIGIDPVVARVNGSPILESQVQEQLHAHQSKASANPAEKDLRDKVIRDLVDSELLYQASVKGRIQVSNKSVDEEIRAISARFSSEAEFSDSLRQEGMTLETMRDRIRRNLAVQQLLRQEVAARVTVSDAEIGAYYAKNRDRMRRPEGAHALEIMTPLPVAYDVQGRQRARQAMEEVLKEARGGRDFASLVREFSQGPSADKGGDLGWLTRNSPRPVLAQAALRLKAGEISDILETSTGLHILKVLEKRPAEDVSLQEARGEIDSLLRREKEQGALKDYLQNLKTGATIEIVHPTP